MPGLIEKDLSVDDLINKWTNFDINNKKNDDLNNSNLELINKLDGEDKYWNIISELNGSNDKFNKYLKENFESKKEIKQKENKEELVSKETDKNKTLYTSKDFEKLESLKCKLHSILDKLNANFVDPSKISSISSKVNKLSSNVDQASEEMNS